MSTSAAARAPRRLTRKGSVIMLTLLGAVAALGAATQTWIKVVPAGADVQIPDINVAGADAAAGITALALVALAGGIALSVGGRAARGIVAVLLALAGVGIGAGALFAVADPAAAAAGVVGKATGVLRTAGEYSLTPMPYLAAAAGLWILACAVVVMVAGRRWPVARKYQPGAAAAGAHPDAPRDAIDDWDRLSRGEDPTG